MAKSIAKQPKRDQVDTEDRIMESVASATLWVQRNKRAATVGLITLVAVAAAVWDHGRGAGAAVKELDAAIAEALAA